MKIIKKIFEHYRIFALDAFKICDCDKFLSTTPVTQFLLLAVTWQNKPTFFSFLYKMIGQER